VIDLPASVHMPADNVDVPAATILPATTADHDGMEVDDDATSGQ
jgi:hypothetical protein